ncbi:MAG: sigma-70 family RNA polymerase sigma factor [Myxococcales bacterium]|nr:sigma-70 family RNA polymerase sigma factor [Myxococcales bacterium]MCB9716557.1 sigma-70 family RNA polymerase sigma factor [Myxococcales bacterium]
MAATDLELLEAWRGGDRAAGEELFERHFDAVARFFRNKVDRNIDDLIQRTFLACVESKDRFRGEASFRTFLFAVAHNVLGKHYRSQRRHGDRIDFGVTSVHDLAPSPSVVVAKHHEHRVLLQGLRRIPLEHQIVLELYYWERLSAAEVGKVLDVPEGTARTRIRRAKQLLEEQMTQLVQDKALLESTLVNLDAWAASLRDLLLQEPDP